MPANRPSSAAGDRLADASRAFRLASLRSEIRRAYVVLGVMGLLALLMFSREATQQLDWRLRVAGAAGIGGVIALQLATLAFARWAGPRERAIPAWFTVLTVIVESLIPTAIMVQAIVHAVLPPYAAMNTPPVLAYGTLIGLTTLRLRPWLCLLSGAVCTAGYTGILAYATYGLGTSAPSTGLPHVAYVNSAALIFISGLAAAWVAHEIRVHVESALREAETRRRMSLIEQDLAAARSIQQAVLPRAAPAIAGFDIAGWNRPAGQTGGDYYDWQQLPDRNWIITLADVSGHGVGPAMVTAACRAYVRASTSHHADLASLTSRINRLLADDLPDGRFVTMVSVLIDPARGEMALLSAGHGPIVLYLGATGTVRDILPRDLPLAIVPDTNFGPAQPIALGPGDVLALVTDGFVEWARPGDGRKREQFGLDRLRDSLRRHAGLASAALIEAVAADVAAFAGAEPQQDDLTMVVIRRTAPPAAPAPLSP